MPAPAPQAPAPSGIKPVRDRLAEVIGLSRRHASWSALPETRLGSTLNREGELLLAINALGSAICKNEEALRAFSPSLASELSEWCDRAIGSYSRLCKAEDASFRIDPWSPSEGEIRALVATLEMLPPEPDQAASVAPSPEYGELKEPSELDFECWRLHKDEGLTQRKVAELLQPDYIGDAVINQGFVSKACRKVRRWNEAMARARRAKEGGQS